jgi:acyl transferase domain-containing protein
MITRFQSLLSIPTFAPAAGRMSFVFGLKGPSLAVDTACSSSIVGAHMSRTAIVNGRD